MRREREAFLRKRSAVVEIQRAFRAWRVARSHQAATLIAAVFRGYVVRKQLCTLRSAAAVIQRAFRVWRERRAYRAAVTIQAASRSYLARTSFLRKKSAAVTIQSAVRNWLVQRRRVQSAIQIQSRYRAYYYRKRYAALRSACVVIQKHFKAYLLGKAIRESYKQQRRACIALQAATRGLITRRRLSCSLHLRIYLNWFEKQKKKRPCTLWLLHTPA